MKTTVLVVTVLMSILFSNVILAQQKNEFKVAYGYSGIDAFYTALQFGEGPHDKTKGTTSISYNRRINNRISIGAQANYTLIKNSELKHIIYPLAKFDFRYINKPAFEMYSSAMAGLMTIEDGFPFHITGLGFRHGKQHALFYELGFGFGHIISVGYSIKI